MSMEEFPETRTRMRFTVIIVDTDLITNKVHKTDLRYFDDFSDACQWIKTHGSLYSEKEFGDNHVSRYFRIEKRYYLV